MNEYLIYEHVDGEIEFADTLEKAIKIADSWEEDITKQAIWDGEWDKFSRIDICKVIETRTADDGDAKMKVIKNDTEQELLAAAKGALKQLEKLQKLLVKYGYILFEDGGEFVATDKLRKAISKAEGDDELEN